jgi:hypothetical protein
MPLEVERLLRELGAPPRLAAHLRLVHDVARELADWLGRDYPEIVLDTDAVLFGAATHDIGKTRHLGELSGPGSAHELDGYRLLLDRGVPERLARFARTHASWTAEDIQLEDLLVSLADKVWKAKRVADLEQLVVERLAAHGRQEPWQAFMALDDVLGRVAAEADERLAFQARFPVAG